MQQELTVIFEGKVQGVFFRSFVKTHADRLNLKGYAKNLADGSVEVKVTGEKKVLMQFLKNVTNDKSRPGSVMETKIKYSDIDTAYKGFSIL